MENWDPTHAWVIQVTRHSRALLKVRFATSSPNSKELMAIRKRFPHLSHVALAELKAMASDGEIAVGDFEGREVWRLKGLAEKLHLHLDAEDRSYTSYLPFDRTDGCVWLIEDSNEANAIAERMIAAGVPVEITET